MRKVILICFLVALCNVLYSQYPAVQQLGNTPKTLVLTNALKANDGFIQGVYSDTTSANAASVYFNTYNGASITTYSGGVKWWVRYNGRWWEISGGGGGGSQTLQQVFDTEPGGSQLTKGDTIKTYAPANNGLSLQVATRAGSYASMSTNPYGLNVFSDNDRYTRIQDGQMIQKGAFPFLAQLDRTGKIGNSVGYDSTYDHGYIDRADSIDFVIEDNSYYNIYFVARKSRRNPTYKGGMFFAPLATDYVHIGNAANIEPFLGDKFVVYNNARFQDTLKVAGVLKATGLSTAKKSKQLYFDDVTNMVSVGDTSSGSGVDTAVVREIISDSMTYVKNATTGVGQLLYKQGDTIKAKIFAPGFGLDLDSTTTALNVKVDTLEISTKANMLNVVRDTAAVLRALIGTGGGQTPWLSDINAAHYKLDSLSGLTAFRTISGGGGGTTYATWNPSDKAAGITLSGGNLVAAGSAPGTTHEAVRGTIGKSSGKWYWEVTGTSVGSGAVGVATSSAGLTTILGGDSGGWGYKDDGEGIHSGSNVFFGASFTTADIIGFKLDMDAGTLEVLKNNTSVNTFTGLTGTVYPAISSGVFSSSTFTANFGSTAFTYSVPSGYNSGIYTSGGGGTTYTPSFVVDTSGRVGLGVIDPEHDFDLNISRDSTVGMALLNPNTGTSSLVTIDLGVNKVNDKYARIFYTGDNFVGGTTNRSFNIEARDSTTGGFILNNVANSSMILMTNNTPRLTISGAGAWTVNGSVGTAGQVLQSNGSGTPPSWAGVNNLYNSNGTITDGDREVDGNLSILSWNDFDAFNVRGVGINLIGLNTSLEQRSFIGLDRDTITIYPGLGMLFIDSLEASTSAGDSVLVKASNNQIKVKAQNSVGLLSTLGTTQGQLLYYNGTTWAALNAGTSGQVLQTNGTGANPSWVTPTGGGMTYAQAKANSFKF